MGGADVGKAKDLIQMSQRKGGEKSEKATASHHRDAEDAEKI
jgi:hypothetical protein